MFPEKVGCNHLHGIIPGLHLQFYVCQKLPSSAVHHVLSLCTLQVSKKEKKKNPLLFIMSDLCAFFWFLGDQATFYIFSFIEDIFRFFETHHKLLVKVAAVTPKSGSVLQIFFIVVTNIYLYYYIYYIFIYYIYCTH